MLTIRHAEPTSVGEVGVDHGPKSLELMAYDPDTHTAVVKFPGHRFWYQNPPGDTHKWAPTEYQVLDTSRMDDHGDILTGVNANHATEWQEKQGVGVYRVLATWTTSRKAR